ncbi:hypothetical protein Tco_0878799 [Tanacetum coccineum]|uniref:Secreted protein n=1 Tax=Tanacetum coccineum TaxID=301880 RepID=A0ABQ5C0I0_9ASTR
MPPPPDHLKMQWVWLRAARWGVFVSVVKTTTMVVAVLANKQQQKGACGFCTGKGWGAVGLVVRRKGAFVLGGSRPTRVLLAVGQPWGWHHKGACGGTATRKGCVVGCGSRVSS